MRRILATLLLGGLLLSSAASGAADEPAIVFGQESLTLGEPLRVASDLVQIRLGERLVVSAGRGAELQFDRLDGSSLMQVGRGPVMVIDLAANRVAALKPGSYLIDGSLPAGGADGRGLRDIDYTQGFKLGDGIMVRQQGYLDSLRIDMVDLTHGVASLIRGIVNALH